jgi:hypothetical protein
MHLYVKKLLAVTPIALQTDAYLTGLFLAGCSAAEPASALSGKQM